MGEAALKNFEELDADPGVPTTGDLMGTYARASEDYEDARQRSNYGDQDPETYAPPVHIQPFAVPAVMPIDIRKAAAFLTACMTSHPRVTYRLGAKVPFLRAVPGVDFTKVDCSGFIREAIREATSPMTRFPDGSVVQHDWILSKGFRKSTIAAAKAQDHKVRIAFLRQEDSHDHIGHVVLIYNASTLESHGGVGPDARAWTGAGWQADAHVYELSADAATS